MTKFGAMLPLFLLSGCVSFQPGRVLLNLPARPENCSLRLVSVMPAGAREVGAIDFTGMPVTPEPYLEKLRSETCRMGGDALLIPALTATYPSGVVYGTATVLKLPKSP